MKNYILILALTVSACGPIVIQAPPGVSPPVPSGTSTQAPPVAQASPSAPIGSPGQSASPTIQGSPTPTPVSSTATASPTPAPSPTPTPTPKPRLYTQSSGTQSDLNAVQFLDASTGFVVGDSSTVLKTVDAGAKWTKLSGAITDGRNLVDLSFVDADNGWVVSGQGVYRTTDGGATWTRLSDAFGVVGGVVKFVSANHGFVSGDHGFFETNDGGTTWTEHEGAPRLFAIQVRGDTVFGLANGEVHRYSPGLGWAKVHTFESGGYGRERLFFLSASKGWLHTASKLFRTTDGGTTWVSVAAPADGEYLSLFFLNETAGWLRYRGVGINSDSLYRTLDGGGTWEKVETPFNAMLNNFTFVEEKAGWLVGYGGKIWRYAVQ